MEELKDAIQRVVGSSWPAEDSGKLILDTPQAKIIKTIEWFDDRVYKVLLPPEFDPKRWEFFWSVTTILGIIAKPWLALWYGDLGTERARYRSKLAKDRGSLIHNAIAELLEFDDSGLGVPMTGDKFRQEDWLAILNFATWYNKTKPRILAHDFPIVSYEHKYAGTLDIIPEFDGGLIDDGTSKGVEIEGGAYVLDVKSGNESEDYHCQTALYDEGVVEGGIIKPVGTMIFYTDAKTKSGYKLVVRNKDEVAKDLDTALAIKKVFDSRPPKLPELRELPMGVQLARY
jgi:hypothetical protein